VLGSGGIMSGRDALEFIAVGATAVQVGTASFIRPRAAAEVVEGMTSFLAAHGIRKIGEWRGCLMEPRTAAVKPAPAKPAATKTTPAVKPVAAKKSRNGIAATARARTPMVKVGSRS
jgi:hypothetical protein